MEKLRIKINKQVFKMKILLIGCGNIGTALLNSWINNNIASEIMVIQPSLRNQNLSNLPRISFIKSIKDISPSFTEDLIVLAVKPQHLNDIIFDLYDRNCSAVVVSTLAGISTKILRNSLPNHSNLVRIMPNIAIRNGNSINLTFMLPGMIEQHKQLFYDAFAPSGKIFVFNEERKIDLLTPIFGSGPAYFLLLADVLLKETMKYDISKEDADTMMESLLIGSSNLINKNQSYSELISSICSKKGVTEVALGYIAPQMMVLIKQGLDAALERINELQNENSN